MAYDAGQPVTATITRDLFNNGGIQTTLPDSGWGRVWRPTLEGPFGRDYGERKAVLESLFGYYLDNVTDPDYALAQDPNAGEMLMSHDIVRPAWLKRSLAVSRLPRQFIASRHQDADRQECQKASDYCEEVFDNLVNLRHLYQQMEHAVILGGQGFEFIWRPDANGVMAPKYFYPVHKSWFVRDRIGNLGLLTRETPVWGSYIAVQPMMQGNMKVTNPALMPGKFIYHVYLYEGGPWYRPQSNGFMYWGRGEDIVLFRIITFDNFVLRYRMKWLEKHGMPMTVLEYPQNAFDVDVYNRIVNSQRGESVARVPRIQGGDDVAQWGIKFLEPPKMGYDAFAGFRDGFTKPSVLNVLLGGSNTMDVGSRGSYSATLEQNDTGLEVLIEWDAMTIDTTINTQLVGPIVRSVPKWRNMPDEHLPKHVLTPERRRNRLMELEQLERMAALGAPIRLSDVYDAAGKQAPRNGEAIAVPMATRAADGMEDATGKHKDDTPYSNPMADGEPPKKGTRGDNANKRMFNALSEWAATAPLQ